MPTHQRRFFAKDEFEGGSLDHSFEFLRGFPTLKLPVGPPERRGQGALIEDTETVLYDLQNDPEQNHPISDPEVEQRLITEMIAIMTRNEAPPEAYRRLGFEVPI